jgi:glucosamine kinase
MTLMLAIDGGGTRTRCIAVDRDGLVKGAGLAGPSNHLHVAVEDATGELRAAAFAALSAARASASDVALVSAGLAGVDADGAGAEDAAGMLRTIGFDRALVHGDMLIAHRGALAGEPGVVALAGTGSSVLGIAADGRTIKAGGWGPLHGDQGSAYQIGRLGLAAAAEAFDGSGDPTDLLPRLTRALGLTHFSGTLQRLYSGGGRQRDVAALAPIVDACAEEGDAVAAAICRQAGDGLARLVAAVLRRLHMVGGLVSYQGAVLERSRLARGAFVDALRRLASDAEVRSPRFEPIAGAALLGAATLGWPWSMDRLEIHGGV